MTLPEPSPAMLGLPQATPGSADVCVLPLPFEGTVSYGSGTACGPHAVLAASQQVELWDDECRVELDELSYHTAEPLTPSTGEDKAAYLNRVTATARGLGDLVFGLGGEHSLTPPLVRAASGSEDLSGLTVVQIDAHTDLRDEYEGTTLSHACAMRRLTDAGAGLIAIGVRASCREEYEYADSRSDIELYRAQDLALDDGLSKQLLTRLSSLKGDVYLTIDMDGLCPSLSPSTGTPEPGGLSWWTTLTFLSALLVEAPHTRLIGADFVETVPAENTQVNEFTTARLIGKCLAYLTARRRLHAD